MQHRKRTKVPRIVVAKARRSKASRDQNPGRYDVHKLGREVEHVRVQLGFERKAVCDDCDIEYTQWDRKVTCDGNEFGIAELGRLANYFDAPPNWPFTPWDPLALQARVRAGRSPRNNK